MGFCAGCGTLIVFGPVKVGDRRYCSRACTWKEEFHRIAESISQEEILERVVDIHQGVCPICKGHGPIDVHVAHWAMSYFIGCRFWTKEYICCHSCALRRQIGCLLVTGGFGWMSIPGIVIAPCQFVMTTIRAFNPPDRAVPSERMEKVIRMEMAMVRRSEWAKARSDKLLAARGVSPSNTTTGTKVLR